MTTNPFDFDEEDGDTMRSPVPEDPGELLDRYGPRNMPDPASLRVPDDPGELMDEDEDEDDDPDAGFDDRESYSM